MLIVLSPAKKIAPAHRTFTEITRPVFLKNANNLVKIMQNFKRDDLEKLMNISPDLARLNEERYLNWQEEPRSTALKQAILMFQGMAYLGLDAASLSDENLQEAQKRLRILSGLYGILRPLDGIQPYRLEMGIPLKNDKGNNLYEYWGTQLTAEINKILREKNYKALINLSSQEYFKALQTSGIEAPIIMPVFKDNRGKGYKVMAVYAKKARGLMARFIIENKLTNPADLQAFDHEGYFYNAQMSTKNIPVFTRDH